jgi:hypothetical protein
MVPDELLGRPQKGQVADIDAGMRPGSATPATIADGGQAVIVPVAAFAP